MGRAMPNLACGAVVVLLVLTGCPRDSRDVYREVETHSRIWDCIVAIRILRDARDDKVLPLPTSNAELVRWLSRHQPAVLKSLQEGNAVDSVSGGIVDAWGNPLIVLKTEDGKLRGIGSAGQNGTWEVGGNDDIVIMLPPRGSESRPTSSGATPSPP